MFFEPHFDAVSARRASHIFFSGRVLDERAIWAGMSEPFTLQHTCSHNGQFGALRRLRNINFLAKLRKRSRAERAAVPGGLGTGKARSGGCIR